MTNNEPPASKTDPSFFALLWAWLLSMLGRTPRSPKERTFTRVGYKRRGFSTWVVDLETKDRFCIRAESVPEAKQFVAALTFGAIKRPKMPAREVAAVAIKAVERLREHRTR